MAKLHASLTPNVLNAGETLTLSFDGSSDSDDVTVQLFEVDDASPFEAPGKPKLVITLHGKLVQDVFTLTPPKGGGPNPDLPAGSKDAPKFTLEVGSQKFDVPLPDKTREQGMFELRLKAESKGKAAASFTTPEVVLVRAFEHFQVNGEKRPVIAFITGAESDAFFNAAEEFWKLNADIVVKKKGLSLSEILSLLDKQGDKVGTWGQVNIVAHGRERLIVINLQPNKNPEKPLNLHRDLLSGLDSAAFPAPASVTDETEIVFRACNAGQDQELVDAIKSNVFPTAKFVKVPKFVQRYEFTKTTAGTTAKELFQESLSFDRPTQAKALADKEVGLRGAFEELSGKGTGGARSPGLAPSAKAADEIPTFDELHDFTLDLGELIIPVFEADTFSDDGKPLDDAALVQLLRDGWVDPQKFHEKSVTWETGPARWELKFVSKALNKNPEGDPGFLFELKKGAGKKFTQTSGSIALGSNPGKDQLRITATGVQERHAVVVLSSETTIEVQGGGAGTLTLVQDASGSRKVENDDTVDATLPAQLTLGEAVVAIRRGRVLDLKYTGSRFFLDRRRTMRTFESAKAYGDRTQVVVPKLDDPLHYGTGE